MTKSYRCSSLPWRAPTRRGRRFLSEPAGALSRILLGCGLWQRTPREFSRAEECGSAHGGHPFVETLLSQLLVPLTHSRERAAAGAAKIPGWPCDLRTLTRTGWTLRLGEYHFLIPEVDLEEILVIVANVLGPRTPAPHPHPSCVPSPRFNLFFHSGTSLSDAI